MIEYKEQIKEIIQFNPPYLSNISPSDWAESKRVMSSDVSPFPGKFSYDRSPYLREIVDCLSPDHPARVVAIMKGAQLGFSTGVLENGIGWIIDQNPAQILLAARDESLVKKMMDTKVDQMIDSCGLRHLIKPNVLRKKNQRSGDTSLSKEFAGGGLTAFSIRTPGRARQIGCKYGFLDDFEAAIDDPNAGSADKLFETRFKAYQSQMKLFFISTPETKQGSKIEPVYLRGDQRRYMIPCACCGDHIPLEWTIQTESGEKAGITYKIDNHGKLIAGSVVYVCQSCGGSFTERGKMDFLQDGIWKPTAESEEDGYYSYHLSTLYAPPGMADWEAAVRDYLYACPVNGEINKMAYKTFVNTILGNTWEDKAEKTDAKGLALNTRDYEIGVIPEQLSEDDGNGKIVMITCASDLNGVEEDARLDYEIVAWSENGSSYSVDHGSIGTFIPRENTRRKKSDRERWTYEFFQSNSVWPEFQKILDNLYITDTGRQMKIQITGVDTGHYTKYAYSFIDKSESVVFGLKGKDADKSRKDDVDLRSFRYAKERSKLFLVEVNSIKDSLASLMRLKWNRESDQMAGYLNFPTPSGGKYTFSDYFSHFESEHKVIGKTGARWIKKNQTVQNHLWDCRIYNMVLKDILQELICKDKKVDSSWINYVHILNNSY